MLCCLWVVLVLVTHAQAVKPLVDLSYIRYEGTILHEGITQWLGMRYAAAPIGNLRFAPPQDPPSQTGTIVAKQHGKTCLSNAENPPNSKTDEDCLFLDIYAPSAATSQSKLPVYFFIQGGGFSSNSNPNFNGSGLVTASGNNIIVVTFNYRVGVYGFLAGSQIRDDPSTSSNNGLKDQRQAMQWVQKHISSFGGDPTQIVIGGDSAGAASISLHLTAYGGRDDKLFRGAAAESVAFAPVLTVDESQYQFDNFVSKLKCGKAHDTISCLRSKSVVEIQASTGNIPYHGAQNPPLYMWNPVIDGSLIQDYPYRAFEQGKFVRIPVIVGDDTNGGTVFTPRHTNTLAESDTFLHNQFPALTPGQLSHLNTLYPNPGLTFPDSGAYWRQISNVYGEMRYMCPGLFISSAYAYYNVSANWNYRYNVEDPKQIANGLGVPHTVEINAIWGPENVGGGTPATYRTGGINAWVVPQIQGYWTSFIRSLDPNTHRQPGSTIWAEWTPDAQQKLIFQSALSGGSAAQMDRVDVGQATMKGKLAPNGQRRLVFQRAKGGGSATQMEIVDPAQAKRCRYQNSIGVSIQQ